MKSTSDPGHGATVGYVTLGRNQGQKLITVKQRFQNHQ